MDMALLRGLPEIAEFKKPKPGAIAIVGSGPSVIDRLETIRLMKQAGTPVVAVKDAQDWLLENGIIPDYAFAVDPRRSTCFTQKHPDVQYVIASQCAPEMFENLKGMDILLWHAYIKKDTFYPPGKFLIPGATTSGLRALPVFYTQGWRHFALFGFDSCLSKGILRVNGTEANSEVYPVVFYGKTYYCNCSMALQAQNFQDHYTWMPDAHFYAYGEGLIPDIIRQRQKNAEELVAIPKQPDNGRVSFIHKWNDQSASYRYRAQIPSLLLSASMNDLSASTLIFSKPQAEEVMDWARAKRQGSRLIMDFCDDHFEWTHYQEALKLADVATCPTETMAEMIRSHDPSKPVEIISDPYEFDEAAPHCEGVRLLWFGHGVNQPSLDRVLPDLQEYPLRVVSNFPGAIPWSKEILLHELDRADIVIMPATEPYKSANRTVEAIRRGCFVVAEPHPAIQNIPGIWIGNIKEGIEVAKRNTAEARQRTAIAQRYVSDRYAPLRIAQLWRTAIEGNAKNVAASTIRDEVPAGA